MQISAIRTPTDFILSLKSDVEAVSAAFNHAEVADLSIDEFLVLLNNRLGGDCICPPGCYDDNVRAKFIVEVDVPWEAEVSVDSVEEEVKEFYELLEGTGSTPKEELEAAGVI